MTRRILLGAGAIAALTVGSIAALSILEGADAPARLKAPAGDAPAPPEPPPLPVPQVSPSDFRSMRAAVNQRTAPPPAGPIAPPPPLPPAPPPATWASVEVANPFGVGSLGPAIMAELARLKPQLGECFSAEGQARYAQLGKASSKLAGGDVKRHLGPAIVLLSLEGDGHELTVVDAPVESRGAASDGTLNCAQAKLRGARLRVGTEGATRLRYRYILRP
jgi:hypothetical protein